MGGFGEGEPILRAFAGVLFTVVGVIGGIMCWGGIGEG